MAQGADQRCHGFQVTRLGRPGKMRYRWPPTATLPPPGRAIRTVVDNGRLVLASLRALVGAQAPILVATVDDPSDSSGDAGRLGLPPWPAALELLVELNRALRTLGEDYRALVADVHARFLGHGLATGNPGQAAARPGPVVLPADRA